MRCPFHAWWSSDKIGEDRSAALQPDAARQRLKAWFLETRPSSRPRAHFGARSFIASPMFLFSVMRSLSGSVFRLGACVACKGNHRALAKPRRERTDGLFCGTAIARTRSDLRAWCRKASPIRQRP